MNIDNSSSSDGQESVGLQAGAADECTVHSMLAQQRGGVIRLDAAAVLDGERPGRILPEHPTEAAPDDGVRVLGLLGGGVLSETADCPDRFVRDDQASRR